MCTVQNTFESTYHHRLENHITFLIEHLRSLNYPFLTLRIFLGLPTLKEVYSGLAQSALKYGISMCIVHNAYGRKEETILTKLIQYLPNLPVKLNYEKEIPVQ